MNQIFILRGSPASGKGTITTAFLKEIPGKVAYIELDKFRWGFHLVNRTVPEVTEEEHELAYQNYLSVLENYLKNGDYTIVTEGLFSWDVPSPHGCMQDIVPLCEKYGYEANPVLLFADFDTLWNRNQERKYSVPEEEFRDLYSHVMKEHAGSELKIDVGKNTIEQSVKILKDLLK